MNLSLFISRRISNPGANTFSSTIQRIAVLSIAVGLAIMIISFMILKGFQVAITNKIVGFGGHIQITKYSLNSTYEELPISKEDSFYQTLRQIPFISHIQGVSHKVGLFQTDEEVHGVVFKGVDENFNLEKFGQSLLEGRFLERDENNISGEIIISKRISDLLKLKLNDEVRIYFIQNPVRIRKLKIVGIFTSGMEEFDDKIIIGDIGVIQQLNDWRSSLVGTLEVFINDFGKINEAEKELFNISNYDLYVDKITDKHIEIFDWLDLIGRNVNILLTLILFVASFNMISILLILIMERTQMIGILKALGASNRFIRRIFVFNGMRLVLIGLFFGNFIALLFGWLQDRFDLIPLDPENYYMSYVPIEWDWIGIAGMNILLFIVVSIVLLVPTFIISRISPIRSIRFD